MFNFTVLLSEIWFEYVRSRGPGGQHVNKTNSAAILKWHIRSSNQISEEQKLNIENNLSSFINSDGYLLVRSDQYRSQEQNRKACLAKLRILVTKAVQTQKPRIPTKPKKSSVKKRIESKRSHSETKKMRRKVSY